MTAVVLATPLDGRSPKQQEPKKELVGHDLVLDGSDYSSADEEGEGGEGGGANGGGGAHANSRHRRTSAAGGAVADCEGPNWKASVQQYDNFLCRVHAQVRFPYSG